MQVRRKRKRDTVRYLVESPPTVLPPLWGWRCWLQEPAVSEQRLTPHYGELDNDRTMPFSWPIRSVTSTTSDKKFGSDWASLGNDDGRLFAKPI